MFKPKSQKEQPNQPFYLSWFTNQGENLKRGGTAPNNESRKDRLAIKSPYQQPLTTLIHVAPNPYAKVMFDTSHYSRQQPRAFQSHIQQISKIYAGQSKQYATKRRSQEYGRNRYDQQKSGRNSLQPSRTFTQQNQRRPQLRPSTQHQEKLPSEIPYMTDDEEQNTPREHDQEQMELNQEDDYSNRSQEADSEGQQSIHLTQKEEEADQMLKNKSFVQRQNEEPIISLRKTNASMNRPQTSEGGRRKRFGNSLNSQEERNKFNKRETEHNILECDREVIKEDELENLPHLDDFEKIHIPTQISSPKELISIRSGQRRKQGENELLSNNRPPSRHKTPPKATDLEVPNTKDAVEIPIKNMYAHLEKRKVSQRDEDPGDDFEMDSFKMNNKFNFQYFQKEERIHGYQTDLEPNLALQHPKSAKSSKLYQGNGSISPSQKPNTSHALRLTEPQTEIVIKYNTSSALSKQGSNQPVKVPFQTSLGQDFLRLFANNFID